VPAAALGFLDPLGTFRAIGALDALHSVSAIGSVGALEPVRPITPVAPARVVITDPRLVSAAMVTARAPVAYPGCGASWFGPPPAL